MKFIQTNVTIIEMWSTYCDAGSSLVLLGEKINDWMNYCIKLKCNNLGMSRIKLGFL